MSSYTVPRNNYWSISDILFIEEEMLALLPDDVSRGYVHSCFRAAENGTMQKWRLNRIIWNQLHDPCWEMFQLFPLDVMTEYKRRKDYYIYNNGDEYYENKIRNTIDWRSR